MSTELTTQSEIIASLVINGDLSKLNADQKVQYYRQFCERLGLDPISQPFKLLKLQGKETLYCDRGGAQQLSRVHNVSHSIKSRETISGCYCVTAQALDMTGRHTESIGAVNIDGLKGEALCNAMMKAETKAKRRATLDLLGLGMLDETEVETIPYSETQPVIPASLPELVKDSEDFSKVLNALKDKKCDINYVKSKFIVSPELEAELFAEVVM